MVRAGHERRDRTRAGDEYMSDEKVQVFSHHEGDKADFETGLRRYFDYCDLGIKDATHGDFVAHIVRAKEGHSATGQWHYHDCDFQMYYVLKGWARFEYEGQGVHVVRKGDCVLQPARIKHREIEHSADLQILEIVAPANFETHVVEDSDVPADAAE
jgi:quercetin dioxygenase-like cupin family protein